MIALLASDWRKLRHRWMPRILLVILVALTALIFLGVSSRAHNRADLVLPDGLIVALALGAGFAPFIWPVLAGSWSGGEYGWGTVRMALARRPNRVEFTLSGLIMVLLTIGAGLCLVLLAGAIAGALVGAATNTQAAASTGASAAEIVIKLFFAAWYTSAFYAVLAYGSGAVFRSAPAGIGIGIGFGVAQTAVSAIFMALGDPWKSIAEHFPNAYTTALTSRVASEFVSSGPFGRVPSDAASITASIVGLAIYFAVILAVMLTVVQRRDVTS